MSVVLLLAPLHSSALPDSRNKSTAVQQIPNQNPRKHLSHIYITSVTSVLVTGSQSDKPQGSSRRSPREESLLSENVKGLSRNRIGTPSFNTHRLVFFFLFFLSSFCYPLLWFPCQSPFVFLSCLHQLPSTNCSINCPHAWPCTLLRCHHLPLAMHLCPAGFSLLRDS